MTQQETDEFILKNKTCYDKTKNILNCTDCFYFDEECISERCKIMYKKKGKFDAKKIYEYVLEEQIKKIKKLKEILS